MNNLNLLVVRLPLLRVLVHDVHMGVLTANILTLVVVFLARFLFSERLIYEGVRHHDVRSQ